MGHTERFRIIATSVSPYEESLRIHSETFRFYRVIATSASTLPLKGILNRFTGLCEANILPQRPGSNKSARRARAAICMSPNLVSGTS